MQKGRSIIPRKCEMRTVVVADSFSWDSIPFPLFPKCNKNMEIPNSIIVVSQPSEYRVSPPDELGDAQKKQFGISTSQLT